MTGVESKLVGAGEDGMRLDRWFKTHYATLPHSRLEKLLRTGQVRVDGARAKASTRLAEGQTVRVPPLPDVAPPPGPKHKLSKADRDFLASITLYEDDDLLVLNKPSGIAVQGGSKTPHHIDRLLEGMGDGTGRRGPDWCTVSIATRRACWWWRNGGRWRRSSAAPSRPARCARSIGRSPMACRSRRKARSRRPW